ncbi:hypothetical protein AGMMS50239_20560 [Bacteroidia bacterium]|nr:hypothetical protein AGMMS50239_20560 [Bacteroidia bacterium]
MKIKSIVIMAVLLAAAVSVNAQAAYLIVNSEVRLPKDSVESAILISTLNDFLIAAQQSNEDNQRVLPSEKIETYILLDEFKDITKTQKDNNFFKPYLTNVMKMNDEQYLIQLSYMGVRENTSYLRASFEIMATKVDGTFLYSSPLLRNTKDWESATIGNCIFHYPKQLNREQAESYSKYVAVFDGKLKSPVKTTEYYCCGNFHELQKLLGIDYKLDYTGYLKNSLTIVFDDKALILAGYDNATFENFDPHDLFHSRVNMVIPADKRNNVMVCGCAYIHGGSWGISWEEIQKIFKAKLAGDKTTDWLKLYLENYNLGTKEKDMTVSQVINALICRKVEKEQGFSAVMELLASGKAGAKDKEHFFGILEKVTGINEKNFNKEVWKLINEKQDETIDG